MARVSARIYPVRWFTMPALALETPSLRLVTVPKMGAKIVSVFDHDAQHEWLLPPKDDRFQPAAYGAPFVEQDMSGWDEMFPTIDSCRYPSDDHAEAILPDHGEVWSLAWEHDPMITDAVRLSVAGRTLPYRLSRTIRMVGDRTARLSYEVVNIGSEPLFALWAAHPQFAVDDTIRIVLPGSVSQVVNVQATDELPVIGQLCAWTETNVRNGQPLRLDRIRTTTPGGHRKFYLPPDDPVSWAGLRQGDDGAWLRLSWDVDEIPYLGIWIDEGAYNPKPTIALEPATGYYDSLALARQNRRVMELLPDTACRWSLDLTVGSGRLSES